MLQGTFDGTDNCFDELHLHQSVELHHDAPDDHVLVDQAAAESEESTGSVASHLPTLRFK